MCAGLGKAVLRRRRALQQGERRDEVTGRAAQIEAPAGLELAQELVGSGLAIGGARLQAGDVDGPPQLVGIVGVGRQRIDVDRALGEAAVEAGLHGVGDAAAFEAAGPLAAGLVAHGDAGQEVGSDLAVEAAREAADTIGEGAGIVVAGDGAGAADRAAPGAPQRGLGGVAGDIAGFGQCDLRAAAAPAAGAVGEVGHEELRALHHGIGEARVVLAADRSQRRRSLRGAENAERVQHGTEVAGGGGVGDVEHAADGALVGRSRAGSKGAGRLEQQQIDVVGVVRQRRGQEREIAGDARVGAIHPAGRVENGVGGVAAVGARLGQHLHGAAVDRCRAADIDPVAQAGRVDLDLVGRAGRLHEVAADREGADRVARRQRAGIDDDAADRAAAAQGAAVHRNAARQAAVHDQPAGIERRAAGVGVGACQGQRAAADLDQRTADAAGRTAVGDDAAHRGRKVVGTDRELLRADLIEAGAGNRTGRRPARRQAREVDDAAAVVDDGGVARAARLEEIRSAAAVVGDGGIRGTAGLAEVRNPAAVVDDGGVAGAARCEEIGAAGQEHRPIQRTIGAVDEGRAAGRAGLEEGRLTVVPVEDGGVGGGT